MDRPRIDKWLWAARFYKTRALAVEALGKGRVAVNGQPAKASREVKIGDRIEVRMGPVARTVIVQLTETVRGPAPRSRTMYEETPESIAALAAFQEARQLAPDPAQAFEQGRPTKRDRRQLVEWSRWSASVDPD